MQSDNITVTCVRNAKKVGITDFVPERKCVENYPDLEKLAPVIQHGLRACKNVKNVKDT